MLNTGQRLVLLIANISLGLIPSIAFFAWVERNSSLPWIGLEWGWPWLSFQTWPIWAMTAWNFALFLCFGLLHSVFAQARAHRRLERILPHQSIRTAYLVITGLSLIGVMGLWQNTGIIVWTAPLGPLGMNLLSLSIYWGLLLCCLRITNRFGILEFLGLRQIYAPQATSPLTSGTNELVTRGLYARVRHPIYTLTLLAFALTPWMTLDRLTVIAAAATYLTLAIPIEERKLVAAFGDAYERYRSRVPAVIPFIAGPLRGRK